MKDACLCNERCERQNTSVMFKRLFKKKKQHYFNYKIVKKFVAAGCSTPEEVKENWQCFLAKAATMGSKAVAEETVCRNFEKGYKKIKEESHPGRY